MEQGHKVLFVLFGLVVVAVLLGIQKWPISFAPAFVAAPANDPDSVTLGASGTMATNENLVGPRNLTANVPLFFPPPLAHLNPVTSRQMTSC